MGYPPKSGNGPWRPYTRVHENRLVPIQKRLPMQLTVMKDEAYLAEKFWHCRDLLIHGCKFGCNVGGTLNLRADCIHGGRVVVLVRVVQERNHSTFMFVADPGKDITRLDHLHNDSFNIFVACWV